MDALFDLGFVGIVSFGVVAIADFFLAGKSGWDSRTKAASLIVVAFILSYVPTEFANVIAEKIKDAVYVGASVTAIYTASKNVAKKLGETN